MDDFVSTRASQIKKNTTNTSYFSVNYNAPKKKSKMTDNSDNKNKLQKDHSIDPKMKEIIRADMKKQQEKEMKKARYDVIKFGISGFKKVKAKKAKVELAISLGAVPPKNKGINYKTLKIQRKKEKIKKKREEKYTSGFSSSLFKPKTKKVAKKDSSILGVYGKVSKDALSKRKS